MSKAMDFTSRVVDVKNYPRAEAPGFGKADKQEATE